MPQSHSVDSLILFIFSVDNIPLADSTSVPESTFSSVWIGIFLDLPGLPSLSQALEFEKKSAIKITEKKIKKKGLIETLKLNGSRNFINFV